MRACIGRVIEYVQVVPGNSGDVKRHLVEYINRYL